MMRPLVDWVTRQEAEVRQLANAVRSKVNLDEGESLSRRARPARGAEARVHAPTTRRPLRMSQR